MSESSLTEFLLARIAEDEEAARDAYDGDPWCAMSDPDGGETWVAQRDPDGNYWRVALANVNPVLHIARHDPKRVLAECEARRQIVTACSEVVPAGKPGSLDEMFAASACRFTLAQLALPYADHDDYDESWRP